MNVLVACEYSGIVSQAFRDLGHTAFSCDLLHTDGDPAFHVCEDVLELLKRRAWYFDLLIAHPPCQYLSYAANRYWNRPGRQAERDRALDFFLELYNADIPRVCIENPVGLPNTVFRAPDQLIEPFYFGDRQRKRTCLWLRRLPPLEHRATLELFGDQTHTDPPEPIYTDRTGKARYFTDANHGGHARSRTFPGIARAMAEQWGQLPVVSR